MNTYSAAELSGDVVVPADDSIFSKHVGRLRVNDVAGYRLRWGLMTGAIDPRWLFADCDGAIETQGPSDAVTQTVASISEDGIEGPDSQIRFGKTTDPDDETKACYILRWEEGDDASLQRTELSFSATFTPVPLGTTCWIGFAVRIPSEWKAAAANDETLIFQLHATNDVGDTVLNPPISIIVRSQGTLMLVRSNPNATSLTENTTYAQVWSEETFPENKWQFYAVKLKSHYDVAQSPRLEVWRRVEGTTTKIIDYSGANAYNNTARDYVKSGIYYYDDEWSGGLTERVMYHKGLYQWLDGEDVSEETILDFLETI